MILHVLHGPHHRSTRSTRSTSQVSRCKDPTGTQVRDHSGKGLRTALGSLGTQPTTQPFRQSRRPQPKTSKRPKVTEPKVTLRSYTLSSLSPRPSFRSSSLCLRGAPPDSSAWRKKRHRVDRVDIHGKSNLQSICFRKD